MRIILLILSIFIATNSIAQNDSLQFKHRNFKSISGNFQYGNILPTTDFVMGDNLLGKPMENYRSFGLKLMWQNPGYTDWQKIYRAPYYGIGLSLIDLYNREEVGLPVSIYGVLGIPVKRWQKLELFSEFQFGVTAGWKGYDSIQNRKNVAIGGALTVHLNIGIKAFYPITNHLDLGAGLSFIHFSNGGFERPNRGFNIYSPTAELKYYLGSRPNVRAVKSPARLERSNDLLLMLGYGDHQLVEHELDTNYFAVAGFSAIYYTQLSNALRLGYGADLNYWWGLNSMLDGTPGPYSFENATLGIIFQPEIIINKLTLVSGIGVYAIHRNYGNFNQTYQRLGVRYNFYKNLSLGVNVRAINFTLAEFLEFNMGYCIKWKK